MAAPKRSGEKSKQKFESRKTTGRSGHPVQPGEAPAAAKQRLQRVLAAAGYGSRRQCEELILAGRVEVDGQRAELGMRVDPSQQEIRVDGTKLKLPKKLYYAVHKPAGVVCTHRDPSRRTRVVDLVPAPSRVFPVGRLDRSSEGLILLTNDGEFANLLAHPRYQVEKTYRTLVAGKPSREVLQKLLRGIHLAEGVARAKSVHVCRSHKQSTELEIVLCEGKNREIRRMLARLGHKVMRLQRIAIGPLRLGKLPVGAYRPLTAAEVAQLKAAARAARTRNVQSISQQQMVDSPKQQALPVAPIVHKTGSVLEFDEGPSDETTEIRMSPRRVQTTAQDNDGRAAEVSM